MSDLKTDRDITAVDNRGIAKVPWWRRVFLGSATWVLALDIALIIYFTLAGPDLVFASVQNFENLALGGSEGLLLAVATAMLLGAGLIDLSLGVNLVFSSVIGAYVMTWVSGGGGASSSVHFHNVGLGISLGLLACVVTGVLFGLVNGLIIAYLKVNSLIATLGTMSAFTGVVDIVTNGTDIGNLPPQMQNNFGLYDVFNVIPLPALVALAIGAVLWLIVRYTRFGLYTIAIGSSDLSANRAGIRVKIHMLKLTMLAGGLAGIAGFLDLGHFGATTIQGHNNDPLNAITAAVIGGAALAGGRISIVGTLWGTVLAEVLIGGLTVVNANSYFQLVVVGGILIAAVSVDQFRNRRRERR
jgi:ribose transport system permease protein